MQAHVRRRYTWGVAVSGHVRAGEAGGQERTREGGDEGGRASAGLGSTIRRRRARVSSTPEAS
eukprot:4108237-Prymnesium_polylepis.3